MKRRHLRGSTTAGRGYGKRARHAGNRGGRGKAGGGKRGQQNMMSIRAHEHTYETTNIRKIPLNLNSIDKTVKSLEAKGLVKREGDKVVVNLSDLGYSKVCGKFSNGKLKLIVHGKASEKARDEIVSAGGEVI